MNTLPKSNPLPAWGMAMMLALGFWLSTSLLLDLLVIPGLSTAGMMTQKGFASAGYLIFGIFNRLELVCAGVTLTACLVFARHHILSRFEQFSSLLLSGIVLSIAVVYTYILTPEMSGLGLQLNLFDNPNPMCGPMVTMHQLYWGLEVVKLISASTLLRWCYRRSTNASDF